MQRIGLQWEKHTCQNGPTSILQLEAPSRAHVHTSWFIFLVTYSCSCLHHAYDSSPILCTFIHNGIFQIKNMQDSALGYQGIFCDPHILLTCFKETDLPKLYT